MNRKLIQVRTHLNAMTVTWVMNNIWEVNFDPNLGGFHEFCYAISWSTQLRDLNQATRKCRTLCEQLRAFQVPGIDGAMSHVST